jgi:hypothetical protein
MHSCRNIKSIFEIEFLCMNAQFLYEFHTQLRTAEETLN